MCGSSKLNISVNYKEVNQRLKYIYNYQQIPIWHEIIRVRAHNDSKSNVINTNDFVFIVEYIVGYDFNGYPLLLYTST